MLERLILTFAHYCQSDTLFKSDVLAPFDIKLSLERAQSIIKQYFEKNGYSDIEITPYGEVFGAQKNYEATVRFIKNDDKNILTTVIEIYSPRKIGLAKKMIKKINPEIKQLLKNS